MSFKSILALACTAFTVAVVAPAAAGDSHGGGAPAAPHGLKTYIKITNYQTVAVTCTAYRESDNAAVASGTVRARQSGEQQTSATSSFDPLAGNPDLYMKCVGGTQTVTIKKPQNKLKLNVTQMINVECNGQGSSLQCRADVKTIERA